MNLFFATGIFLLVCSFSFQHNYRSKEAVVRAMKKYDDLILKMDVDSVALLYMPDGDLGNIAHGRDSIRNFLTGLEILGCYKSGLSPGTIPPH